MPGLNTNRLEAMPPSASKHHLGSGEENGSTPADHFRFDGPEAFGILPRAVSPPARIWQHVGSVVVLTEQLYWVVRRRACVELAQSFLSRCHGLYEIL